jgi:hypothetical protein
VEGVEGCDDIKRVYGLTAALWSKQFWTAWISRFYIQDLPYCVRITDLAPNIPTFGTRRGFISCTLNR